MSVQEYIDKHELTKVVEDAVNAAVKVKPDEPLSFLVRGIQDACTRRSCGIAHALLPARGGVDPDALVVSEALRIQPAVTDWIRVDSVWLP